MPKIVLRTETAIETDFPEACVQEAREAIEKLNDVASRYGSGYTEVVEVLGCDFKIEEEADAKN